MRKRRIRNSPAAFWTVAANCFPTGLSVRLATIGLYPAWREKRYPESRADPELGERYPSQPVLPGCDLPRDVYVFWPQPAPAWDGIVRWGAQATGDWGGRLYSRCHQKQPGRTGLSEGAFLYQRLNRAHACPGRSDLSGCQTLATFGTATVDHLSAVFGGHTGTKTVGALALQDARLKCSFHG